MSFLYKALLKNNQQSGNGHNIGAESIPEANQAHPNSVPHMAAPSYAASTSYSAQGFAQAGQFAATNNSTTPAIMWGALALALLVIGLLAGYIFGNQQSQPKPILVAPPNTVMSSPVTENSPPVSTVQQPNLELAKANSNTVNSRSAVVTSNSASSNNVENEPLTSNTFADNTQGESATADLENVLANNEVKETNAIDSKVVEASINQEGNLITQISEQATSEEQTPLKVESVDELNVDDIPEVLRQQFAQAVEATEQVSDAEEFEPVVESSSLTMISELSDAERASLPDIEYQMHIFASAPTERWVKLNGRIVTQGETFMPGLKLLEIRQDMIVWETTFNRFSQEALDDYVAN